MKIFINYRREDARDAAFIIAKSLMARFGEHNVFFDRQGIEAGENFVRTIESAFDEGADNRTGFSVLPGGGRSKDGCFAMK